MNPTGAAPPPAAPAAAAALRPPLFVLGVVLAAGALIEGMWFVGSRLWYSPDASHYITLAIAIVEHGDFRHELYAFRPPGYPLMLAGVFALFGPHSADALLAVQHAMVVVIALLTTMLAWAIRPSRTLAMTAGLLCTIGIHLSGYANAVLTEVPYALALTFCMYAMVRFHMSGSRRWLLAASIAGGAAAWIKPIGQLLLLALAAAALKRRNVETSKRQNSRQQGNKATRQQDHARRPDESTRWLTSARAAARGILVNVCVAVVPGVMMLLPVMVQNYRDRGRFEFSSIGGLSWYVRAVVVDRLDSPTSPAMAEVREACLRAGDEGIIDAAVPLHQSFWQTITAIQYSRGCTLPDAAELMGRAGVEMLMEDPAGALGRALYYGYLLMMTPCECYRHSPPPTRDLAMFYDMIAARLGPETLARYLPVQTRDSLAPNAAARGVRWLTHQLVWRKRQIIDEGPPLLGIGDTPYEEYVWVFAAGCVLALCDSRRTTWLLLLFVIGYHAGISAFLQGPLPRYAVPVHPLMHVFEAMALVKGGTLVTTACRFVRGRAKGAEFPRDSSLPTTPSPALLPAKGGR